MARHVPPRRHDAVPPFARRARSVALAAVRRAAVVVFVFDATAAAGRMAGDIAGPYAAAAECV